MNWPTFWNEEKDRIQQQLLSWQKVHGRHDLPWQKPDPYVVWVSEIMLQQTQVSTVKPKFEAWMKAFPDVAHLAQAKIEDVYKLWEGLGYYRRARFLHQGAQLIMNSFGGELPSSRADRLSLPGVGPSTASALGAFAFGQREAIFDGNVQRIWSRWWGDRITELDTPWLKVGWDIALDVMPQKPDDIRRWTQAVMDLGATVCLPKNPKCEVCPWRKSCRAHLTQTISSYPPAKSKTQVLDEQVTWGWLSHEGRVAISPPNTEGKWAGLARLPEVQHKPEEVVMGQGQHRLTHRLIHWHIIRKSPKVVRQAERDPTLMWVDRDTFEAQAWPRWVRKWWDELDENAKSQLFSTTDV